MEVTTIPHNHKKISKILHFADVHIRLNSRHDEFRIAFSKLYDGIKQLPPDGIVVLAGDIFFTKSELSSEAVQLATELFRNCADIRPLIIIVGNHDALLSNRNRLDLITPIVEALNHPNIHYLKKSGLYGMANVLFNNFSCLDNQTEWLPFEKVPNKIKLLYDRHICLYHGSISGCVTDLGYTVVDRSTTPETFDGAHIALCGDIHKQQTLRIVKDVDDAEAASLVASGDYTYID